MRKLLYIAISTVLLSCLVSSAANVRQDDTERRLQEAVDSGNPAACFHMARMLESSDTLTDSLAARALQLYTRAADSVYPPALNYLGFIRFNGLLGTTADPDTALQLIEKAAMLGDNSAAANLGWLLTQNGTAVRRDPEKALYWLSRAAESGSPIPLEAMADIYLQRGDTVQALSSLEEATLHGGVNAAGRLLQVDAQRFDAMPTDSLMKEALRYYRSGAPAMGLLLMDRHDLRDDATQPDLALSKAIRAQLMSLGLVLPYDYEGSLRLFHEAAEMGDPSAQYIVAETLDLTPDAFAATDSTMQRTADEWRRAAAAQGIADSHVALRRLLP